MKLGMATQRPEQVIGIHFFNPVPVLRLVELVTSLLTSPRHDRAGRRLRHGRAAQAGDPQSQDRAGFIVNALLIPYILSAIRMMESGFAQPEDIDTGMVEGCNHPMGPLRLADLIGLDTTMAVAESACTPSSRSRSTRRRRCCPGWSRPGCSAARPAAGSTTTTRSRGRHERPDPGGQGRSRRPRPRREGGGPHPARRRLRGDLHRPVPDAGDGGGRGGRRGRRRHRPLDAVRRPHDARPEGGGEGARARRRHPGGGGRHHPRAPTGRSSSTQGVAAVLTPGATGRRGRDQAMRRAIERSSGAPRPSLPGA